MVSVFSSLGPHFYSSLFLSISNFENVIVKVHLGHIIKPMQVSSPYKSKANMSLWLRPLENSLEYG